MKRRAIVLALSVNALVAAACGTRREECDKFLLAVKPIDEGMPSADMADRVLADLTSLELKDQPLREYRENYKRTLTVVSNSLHLKATTPDPPEGTDDLIKQKLNECRQVRNDVKKYCES